MRPNRPIVRYHGGKWAIAQWIIDHLPEHRVYVEPFAGAASVLLNKEPSRVEVLNDLNQRIVSAFSVLRNPDQAEKLKDLLRLTPCSEIEYRAARDRAECPVEDARRLIVLGHQGHGSTGASGGKLTGWRRGVRPHGPTSSREWADLWESVLVWADRLRSVYLECGEASAAIQRWDAPDALFYVDPPYVAGTRTTGLRGYAHEMTDDDHRKLAEVLHDVQGMVVLSGYPCPLYDEELYPGWQRVQRRTTADKSYIWRRALEYAELNQPYAGNLMFRQPAGEKRMLPAKPACEC